MTDDRKPIKRRDFLTRVGIGGVIATGLASIGATVRYLFPAVVYEPSLRSKVGLPSEFTEGVVTFLPDSKVFLHRDPDGMYAIGATCTHLGCVVAENDEGFICPCHGSVFDPSGNVMGGPAPRPLPWYEISLAPNGQLVVDRARTVTPGTKLKV